MFHHVFLLLGGKPAWLEKAYINFSFCKRMCLSFVIFQCPLRTLKITLLASDETHKTFVLRAYIVNILLTVFLLHFARTTLLVTPDFLIGSASNRWKFNCRKLAFPSQTFTHAFGSMTTACKKAFSRAIYRHRGIEIHLYKFFQYKCRSRKISKPNS